MSRYTDQTAEPVFIPSFPKRIISLVPSQTELLARLGLEDEVIGITKFCVHPERWFNTKTRTGGTKQVNFDVVQQLKPDLIIANKEENVKEQVEELKKYYPVWVSDVNDLDGALDMITQIGIITNRQQASTVIISTIRENFLHLPPVTAPLRTAYLIWQKPYMTVGGDTFIHSMLKAAGFENVFAGKSRYPEITIEELKLLHPDIILLSSEPYPFKQKHADELQQHLPSAKIVLADGEMFSWYGSRLIEAPAYFTRLRNEIK